MIPQVDPEKYSNEELNRLFKKISSCGVTHIAVGGTFVNPVKLQNLITIAVKDFDFSLVTYLSNSSTSLVTGIKNKTAVYWMSIFNAENPFYLRDNLILASIPIKESYFEPIPTAYVFDDRGQNASANWLARATPVPRDKPEISLSIALAVQFLGVRFYIMAGGSGSPIPPPLNHIKTLVKNSTLFIIPTSGINSVEAAKEIFAAGADAIHVGQLIENENGWGTFVKMTQIAAKYDGKSFL